MKDLNYWVKELYFWQITYTVGGFNGRLFELFQVADIENRALLYLSYPLMVQAFSLWQDAGDNGKDLFREYGLLKH